VLLGVFVLVGVLVAVGGTGVLVAAAGGLVLVAAGTAVLVAGAGVRVFEGVLVSVAV